jgi:HEAT repeat protein
MMTVTSLTLAVVIAIAAVPAPIRADEPASAAPEQAIQRWIDQLGSERFKEREQAARELSKLGKSALPGLKGASQSPDAEVRRRAQQLVERIESPTGPPVVVPVQIAPALKIYH